MFNRDTINATHRQMVQFLAEKFPEFRVTMVGGSIGIADATLKFKIAPKGKEADDDREQVWRQYCRMFDLPADAFGQTINNRGDLIKIVGLQPTRHKYPVMGEFVTGRRQGRIFMFTAEMVNAALPKAKKGATR